MPKLTLPKLDRTTLIIFLGAGILGLSFQIWFASQPNQRKERHFLITSVAQTGKYTIVTWSDSVTEQQFWLDGSAASASCEPRFRTCTVPERDGVKEVRFRWLDPSDGHYHQFRCPGTYFGSVPAKQAPIIN